MNTNEYNRKKGVKIRKTERVPKILPNNYISDNLRLGVYYKIQLINNEYVVTIEHKSKQ